MPEENINKRFRFKNTYETRFQFLLLLFFLGIPIGIGSSTIGLTVCTITAEIKKYRSIIKKNRRNIVK